MTAADFHDLGAISLHLIGWLAIVGPIACAWAVERWMEGGE